MIGLPEYLRKSNCDEVIQALFKFQQQDEFVIPPKAVINISFFSTNVRQTHTLKMKNDQYLSILLNCGQQCRFSRVGKWNPCGTSAASPEQCTLLGCCYANNSIIQSYKFPQNCVSEPTKINQNGTCLPYTGNTCQQFLRNETSIGGNIRFFDNHFGPDGTEKILIKFMNIIHLNVKKEECKDLLPIALCEYTLSTCMGGRKPKQICGEVCDRVAQICSQDLQRLLGAVEYIVQEQGIDFSHLVIPDCNQLKHESQFSGNGNDTCIYIGLFDFTNSSNPTNSRLAITIIAIAAAILLLGLLIICCLCYCKKQKTKKELFIEDPAQAVFQRGDAQTMRQRILQEKSNSSGKPSIEELIQYPLDDVEYIQDLGEGQFGRVFQGRITLNDKEMMVAVKTLKEGSCDQAQEAFHQEVTLMAALNHDNILGLLAVSTEEEPFCMIFEFMEHGDLNQFLRRMNSKARPTNTNELSVDDLIIMASQVASGMEYLANKKFVHRDLATRNCLVGKELIVKIADFGMSRDLYASDYYRVGGEAMLPVRWMPPEAVLYGKFTVESDAYSYGVLLWELFTYALQPFYGYSNEEVVRFIKKGVLLPQPDICPDWIYEIMATCWSTGPEDRLTFDVIVNQLNQREDQATVLMNNTAHDIYSVPRGRLSADQSSTKSNSTDRSDDPIMNDEYLSMNTTMNGPPLVKRNSKPKTASEKRKAHKKGYENIDLIKRNPDSANETETLTMPVLNGDASDTMLGTSPVDIYDCPRTLLAESANDDEEMINHEEKAPVFDAAKNNNDETSDEPTTEDLDEIRNKRYISSNDAKKLSNARSTDKFTRQSSSEKGRSAQEHKSYRCSIGPSTGYLFGFDDEPPRSPSKQRLAERILVQRSFKFKMKPKKEKKISLDLPGTSQDRRPTN